MGKYLSKCHNAPVNIKEGQKIKYFCSDCGQPCIAKKVQI